MTTKRLQPVVSELSQEIANSGEGESRGFPAASCRVGSAVRTAVRAGQPWTQEAAVSSQFLEA